MKKNKLTLIISTLLCLTPIIFGMILYDRLPEQIAVHFNAANVPDNYASKGFAIFGIPIFMAILNIIIIIINNNAPKSNLVSIKVKNLVIWLIPILSVITNSIVLLYAVGTEINIGFVITIVVGIIFIVVGNYLPKTKQNYLIGIRLPWTLNSEQNWNKVHHIAGYIWIVGGFVIIIGAFLGGAICYVVTMISIAIMVIVPSVYSYYLYKKGI